MIWFDMMRKCWLRQLHKMIRNRRRGTITRKYLQKYLHYTYFWRKGTISVVPNQWDWIVVLKNTNIERENRNTGIKLTRPFNKNTCMQFTYAIYVNNLCMQFRLTYHVKRIITYFVLRVQFTYYVCNLHVFCITYHILRVIIHIYVYYVSHNTYKTYKYVYVITYVIYVIRMYLLLRVTYYVSLMQFTYNVITYYIYNLTCITYYVFVSRIMYHILLRITYIIRITYYVYTYHVSHITYHVLCITYYVLNIIHIYVSRLQLRILRCIT